MINELAGILLPVFCLALVGYGWRVLGFPFEREFVARVIMNVAGPCLIVDSLAHLTLPMDVFVAMLGSSIAMFVTTAAAALAIVWLLRLPVRSFLPALAVGNNGNLGLPLCLFAFGQEGLGLAVAVFVTNSVGQFTMTPLLQSRTSPWRTLATTPVIYGAVIGAAVLVSGATLPAWIDTTIGLLGDLMIPLMLLALGNTLGGLRAQRLPFAVGMGTARLVLGFAVALGIAELFGLEGVARGVLILQGAMPAAIFNYLFAARYDRHPDDIAGIVLMSTLVSALTLPLLVGYALHAAAP
ncbi:MAG TPA: AEC family transporter [Gammaproteobacteria bacterium]|jgi:predicted permease